MKRPRLRLPLPKRADPVLTEDELECIDGLLAKHIAEADALMATQKVSESVIRSKWEAEMAREKVRTALDG